MPAFSIMIRKEAPKKAGGRELPVSLLLQLKAAWKEPSCLGREKELGSGLRLERWDQDMVKPGAGQSPMNLPQAGGSWSKVPYLL